MSVAQQWKGGTTGFVARTVLRGGRHLVRAVYSDLTHALSVIPANTIKRWYCLLEQVRGAKQAVLVLTVQQNCRVSSNALASLAVPSCFQNDGASPGTIGQSKQLSCYWYVQCQDVLCDLCGLAC